MSVSVIPPQFGKLNAHTRRQYNVRAIRRLQISFVKYVVRISVWLQAVMTDVSGFL
jgi:hypothetical protein